ncbi:phospholipid phosphatase 1-like isoform X2 [Daphnia pulex]|uniref:phospholipid phosphatase 1-like isoform X2 n=1 Tax=Daphnia pulex TaxID=6669 RepID=UPI001EE055A0|nr:phospholipid phosphatase 1-like isoform X2 [Daphnia pulex]
MTDSTSVRQVIIDFICLAIVWVPALIWHLIGKPFQRGFYCDDTSIRYPYKDSTVTDAELIGYSLSVPILLIIIVEIVSWKRNSKWEGIIQQSSSSTTNISSSIRFRSVVIKIVHIVAIFLFGEGCSQLATDIGKYSVGRLRPHFIDVCQPANLNELCPLGGPPIYITDYTCTGTDEKKLLDSRLSFPSGHSSFSAYSMLYLVIYLQCRMNWSGSKLLRPLIQIAALIFSWYTGLSRITDYKHHWSDVLTGFAIGYTAASLTALYIAKFFKPSSYGTTPLLPQNRSDMTDIELQNHSEASAQCDCETRPTST